MNQKNVQKIWSSFNLFHNMLYSLQIPVFLSSENRNGNLAFLSTTYSLFNKVLY